MKRTIASLLSVAFLFTLAPIAEAAYNETINTQPRGSRRAHKQMAVLGYQQRGNTEFLRTMYNAWAQRLMKLPSLAVTGADRSRFGSVNRPGQRAIDSWTLDNHCTLRSNRCK
jgi:hypothetical protein